MADLCQEDVIFYSVGLHAFSDICCLFTVVNDLQGRPVKYSGQSMVCTTAIKRPVSRGIGYQKK